MRKRLIPFYLGVDAVVILVNDGWSGRPTPLLHQILLLPASATFLFFLWGLLRRNGQEVTAKWTSLPQIVAACAGFELLSVGGFLYEGRHFARFGYNITATTAGWFCALLAASIALVVWRRVPWAALVALLTAYVAGMLLAIRSFPLNYLRSDMLPVILWADRRFVVHLNPYGTMHAGGRVYDFPYLPGMLTVFLPAVIGHMDLRYVCVVCVVLMTALLYAASEADRRSEAVALLASFVLSPFLQYRHELYLQPHWFVLVVAVILLQRGQLLWGAGVFGVSMGIYQLSWVLFPFLLLYAFRRRGWFEAVQAALVGALGMLLVLAPFLHSASERIAHNSVGQWSHLTHALADPINLSYWMTYLVRPDQLQWVQLVLLTGLFGYCFLGKRCGTLTDMLRFMSAALALFIVLNVLVDGYFYLTLLVVLLLYTFAAAGIWADPDSQGSIHDDGERRRLGEATTWAA